MGATRPTAAENATLALAAVLAVMAVTLRAISQGIVEMGDGVQHYMLARYAWVHPHLLLDLWGKPLYIVLGSPFAQLGHAGMAAFNAILAFSTCWAGARLLRASGGWTQLAFPLLVLLAPFYMLMTVAGMTEVLFGMLTVLVLLALVSERPVLAAILASLTPFSRPEYIAFLPLVMGWTVLQRQWRVLPWYLTGFVVYAVCAWALLGDPFWFWTHAPYKAGPSPYGSGDLWQFVDAAPDIFGVPLITLFLAALCAWPWVQRKDVEHRRTHRLLLLTAAVPVLLTFAIHSYIWWKGIHASAGLARVLVTIIPLAAAFGLFTWGRVLAQRPWPRMARVLGGAVFFVALVWMGVDRLQGRIRKPLELGSDQQALDRAADALRNTLRPNGVVYSTHPYAAFRAGIDEFDDARYRIIWGLNDQLPKDFFPRGSLIFWDSQLGPNEAHLPLDTLLNDPHFRVLGNWPPREGHTVFGDRPYELFLFERKDAVRTGTTDTLLAWHHLPTDGSVKMDTVACSPGAAGTWCFGDGEFPIHFRPMPLTQGVDVVYDELIMHAHVERKPTPRGSFELVFAQSVGTRQERYDQLDIQGDELNATFRVPPAMPGTDQGLYLWNVVREPFKLRDFTLLRRRWTQRDTTLAD